MRIAVCIKSDVERTTLAKWIRQYCELYQISCTIWESDSEEAFFKLIQNQSVQVAFLGLGGREGLLMTRRLREMDKRCVIVMIDDTSENAVSGVRLHVTDYMVRPIEFKRLVSSMKRVLAGGIS